DVCQPPDARHLHLHPILAGDVLHDLNHALALSVTIDQRRDKEVYDDLMTVGGVKRHLENMYRLAGFADLLYHAVESLPLRIRKLQPFDKGRISMLAGRFFRDPP